LQHALLPKALPVVAGMELAARYIPSATGVEIGGDWYSVVRTDAGRLVFVVGDVSGHGVDAASLMGSLRYTVRALARLGLGPAEILGRAGSEIDIGADGHFATALVGSIDLEADTMTLASAGHPPAVLVRPGEAVVCRAALGPPLGLGLGPYRSTTTEFPRGWSLLAYTDGLIERRTRGIDEGIEALTVVAADGPRGANSLVDHVVAGLTDGRNDDDIAVLCISR
jgi:serine phosphatase RsbU (regulator of sigma subunit)